jgi:DNA-binding MltR family transcriptional regulator
MTNWKKNLRRITREKPDQIEHSKVFREIVKGTDRSAAILCCVQLEDAVVTLILTQLKNKNERTLERLYERGGPLGSFSAQINLAFALGLFDEKTRIQLDTIRFIRNAFAHARKSISFRTPEIAAANKTLVLADNYKKKVRDFKRLKGRRLFIACAWATRGNLIKSAASILRRKSAVVRRKRKHWEKKLTVARKRAAIYTARGKQLDERVLQLREAFKAEIEKLTPAQRQEALRQFREDPDFNPKNPIYADLFT